MFILYSYNSLDEIRQERIISNNIQDGLRLFRCFALFASTYEQCIFMTGTARFDSSFELQEAGS
jgi:hypothetical protein